MARNFIAPNPDDNKGATVFGHAFIFYSTAQRDSYIDEITIELAYAFDRWGIDFMLRTSWSASTIRGQG